MIVPLSLVFLPVLFEGSGCFLLFTSSSHSSISLSLTCRVDLVNLRSVFLVTADEGYHNTKRSNSRVLRESLHLVTETSSKNLYRRFVLELHFELSSLVAKPLSNKSRVIHVSNNDSTAMV